MTELERQIIQLVRKLDKEQMNEFINLAEALSSAKKSEIPVSLKESGKQDSK